MSKERFHGIAVYNPALLSPEELKRYFVARQGLLQQLLDDLAREQPGHAPQHRLLLGLRGMGKTTLLHRLAIAVQEDADLNPHWLPLTFPEEQYNVADLADLWLNCLDALGDQLERSGDAIGAEQLDQRIAELARDDAPAVLTVLLEQAGRQDKRLLLLIDNIDLIFQRLKQQHWVLRETLQSEPRLLLIGASSAAIEASYQYDAAFYDFFKIDELKGLSEREMCDTLLQLAELKHNPAVRTLVEQDRARIKTLHTLTGGNPRTTVLLYNVLAQGLAQGDVRSDLDGLLDQVTPLYKARFEELSAQAQQLVDALALHWDPMNARQLAEALGWEVNTVSAQLNRLQQLALVEKQPPAEGKRHLFQISERFFNIWYLMRASRRVRRKLIWLVQFLRLFFSAEELQQHAHTHLSHPARQTRDAEYNLALAQRAVELDDQDDYFRHTLVTLRVKNRQWPEAAPSFKRLISEASEDLVQATWPDFIRLFREIIALDKTAEVIALLDETGAGARWRPLREALMVIASGNERYLNGVAPEVRDPAQKILAQLRADKKDSG